MTNFEAKHLRKTGTPKTLRQEETEHMRKMERNRRLVETEYWSKTDVALKKERNFSMDTAQVHRMLKTNISIQWVYDGFPESVTIKGTVINEIEGFQKKEIYSWLRTPETPR